MTPDMKAKLLNLEQLAQSNPKLKAAMDNLTDVLKTEIKDEILQEKKWHDKIHPELKEFLTWLAEHRNHEDSLGYHLLRLHPELKPHEEWINRAISRLLYIVFVTEKPSGDNIFNQVEIEQRMELYSESFKMLLQYCRWKSVRVREENAKLLHPASVK
jgi:hypothetical protein